MTISAGDTHLHRRVKACLRQNKPGQIMILQQPRCPRQGRERDLTWQQTTKDSTK